MQTVKQLREGKENTLNYLCEEIERHNIDRVKAFELCEKGRKVQQRPKSTALLRLQERHAPRESNSTPHSNSLTKHNLQLPAWCKLGTLLTKIG